jgi:RHS repeat-associated protein
MQTATAVLDNSARDADAFDRLEACVRALHEQRTITTVEGRTTAAAETGGTRAEYRYDSRGDLIEVREAGGRVSFAYDERRRLTSVRHADGRVTKYSYTAGDRLSEIDGDGLLRRFEHDASGRLVLSRCGNADAVVYRYDDAGRVTYARTSTVETALQYDHAGRITSIRQTRNAIESSLGFEFDSAGRLTELAIEGSTGRVRYEWYDRGRVARIRIGDRAAISYEYDDAAKRVTTRYSNGLGERADADATSGRALGRQITRDGVTLLARSCVYDELGRLTHDGSKAFEYDRAGRVAASGATRYEYDEGCNRVHGATAMFSDERGRVISASGRVFRYDDRDQLREVSVADSVIRFDYDFKGRVAARICDGRVEHYLYGPGDELLAVTNGLGEPVRIYVRTPLGYVAEIHGSVDDGEIRFLHNNDRGSCVAVSNVAGEIVATYDYDAYGLPAAVDVNMPAVFSGRVWDPAVRLYNFGARWYDPALGRFLTRDAYTALPDDVRIVNPLTSASSQAARRTLWLDDWLRNPRLRNPHAFCGNDPVNSFDPNGHWSGWLALYILGAIWTLPNTIVALAIEVLCLIAEPIRLLLSLISGGSVDWQSVGFDAAASGRLDAFALVFRGGWFGSIPAFTAITFGNIFFVNKTQEGKLLTNYGPTPVQPPVYNGSVSLTAKEALYEHELRHTNQYAWFGPFFHLGLPIWGVYEWDWILSGFSYSNIWFERDAQKHSGI